MKPVSAQSFLYFIANDTGQEKIGISRQPDKRLKGLSTASASKLTLLASLHGGRTEEREWHTRFAQKRVSLAERTYYRRKAAGTLDVVPPPMQHAAHVADWFATLTGIERLEHKALVRRCIRACLPACEARLQSAPT